MRPTALPLPEYASVEAFVQFCLDDERTTFLPGEAQRIAQALCVPTVEVLAELRSWGLVAVLRPRETGRGYRTSSMDRYYGPGSEPTHGGTGWEQINGFAGTASEGR